MIERRFYIPPERFAEQVELDADQSRHVSKVLRLGAGDEIRGFDGLGNERLYCIEEIKGPHVLLRFVRDVSPPASESSLALTLAVPILKKSNTELVLQKAVELGVLRFVPLITARSEVAARKWRPERVRKLAYESAKQCGRATVPSIDEPIEFGDFIKGFEGVGFLFYEENGEPLPADIETDNLIVVTGPEGGWEQSEIDLAVDAGFRIVHFGGRILKAETAAIAATAIIQNRFGDIN